ncbi:MAG TPA: 3-hydroxyacyl-CoA dehydrogenase NAD-binding domain-containing protein [Bryobacteraceae bacterium]
MPKPIRRVAVPGAGTMGSRIAAHLANAQIPSLLLDVTSTAARNGLETARKGRPAAFFVPESAALVTPATSKGTSRRSRTATGSSKPSPRAWQLSAL